MNSDDVTKPVTGADPHMGHWLRRAGRTAWAACVIPGGAGLMLGGHR